MKNVGIIFSYAPAREILKKHGAKIEGQTVYFPTSMVESNLKTVPSSFTLYARDPQKNVDIDTERTVFAGPNCSPFVLDLDSGQSGKRCRPPTSNLNCLFT
jgi:trimethylamine--corrinoid protein Co-methyltransferase